MVVQILVPQTTSDSSEITGPPCLASRSGKQRRPVMLKPTDDVFTGENVEEAPHQMQTADAQRAFVMALGPLDMTFEDFVAVLELGAA